MINYSTDQDGTATIEWDMPGRVQNVLNEESIDAFDAAVHRAIADPAVKGILIASAKKDFNAGADLAMVLAQSDAEHLHGMVLAWHRLLREMETAGKPIAAALSGVALGGGLALVDEALLHVAERLLQLRIGQGPGGVLLELGRRGVNGHTGCLA